MRGKKAYQHRKGRGVFCDADAVGEGLLTGFLPSQTHLVNGELCLGGALGGVDYESYGRTVPFYHNPILDGDVWLARFNNDRQSTAANKKIVAVLGSAPRSSRMDTAWMILVLALMCGVGGAFAQVSVARVSRARSALFRRPCLATSICAGGPVSPRASLTLLSSLQPAVQ
jgi:hypothetical protein